MSDNFITNVVVLLTFIILCYRYILCDNQLSLNEKVYSLFIVMLCTIGLIMDTVFNGILVLLLLVCGLTMRHKVNKKLFIACSSFIVYTILQTLIMFNGKQFDSAYNPYIGMFEYVIYTIFILSLFFTRNESLIIKIKKTIISYSIAFYIIGIFEVIENLVKGDIFGRTSSCFTNPNLFGAYASIILICVITNRSIFKKHTFYTILIGSVLFVLLSSSRATWFALTVCGIYYLIKNRKLNLKYILLSIMFIAIFVVINNLLDNELINRIMTAFDSEDASTSDRLTLIIASFEIIFHNLAFGTGIRSFNSELIIGGYHLNSAVTHHPHNAYLELLSTLGLIGFILQFIVVYIVLRNRKNQLNTSIRYFMIFFLSLGIMSRLFNSYPITIMFWLILGFF